MKMTFMQLVLGLENIHCWLVQVAVVGDGRSKVQQIGDRSDLEDYDKLVNIGTEASVPADIQSSFDLLSDKISKFVILLEKIVVNRKKGRHCKM